MATIIEPIHLVAAKEEFEETTAGSSNDPILFGAVPTEADADTLDLEELAALAATASSDSEQVVATIAPPIQSHVVAQIPAVDYNVDAPTEPKIINHQVLSSKIVNPA